MNVGLLDTLGSRYRRFWEPYLNDLGVGVVQGSMPKSEAYALGQESLAGEPPHVQLALGRILELGQADLIVLPQLEGIEGDPWGEAFVDVLSQRVSSLPNLLSVPESGQAAAGAAAELGTHLIHNPGVVRRALDRHRPLLTPAREAAPELSAASKRSVAVIGPDVLLSEPFLLGELPARLAASGLHAVYSSEMPRATVLERGLRSGAGTPGLRALAGAQLALEGKSAVRGLVFVVPARSRVWRQAAERLAAGARKPALVLEVAPEMSDFAALDAFAQRVTLGVAARTTEGEV
ncbi:hypothetical protein [Deinococcus peraridilitoris]|uniref:Uncharacterized protein n=1 Tax=Deinococcus peraridilitoris (strain DSM 19664 / LMG 22246 / CIP 109416 / KR-200) TaxID=937777 RepID=K9ZYE6_DEIPD|nr:hypothetical protein [Deinococcus peraridilitoris]AFZ66668.1 hypothetical protein Deipe_1106 [Deinococcus peraridilitoris DSM 19664]